MTIEPNRHRSLFLSDFHLGSRHCKAKRLYEFLCRYDADTIYLIGDIIEIRSPTKWPPFHDDVLKVLCDKALSGTKLVFVPGNHDSLFRYHIGQYGNLHILNHVYHECVGGGKLLIIHGDETDLFKIDKLLWFIVKLESVCKIHLWEYLRKYFSSLIWHHTELFKNKIMKKAASHKVCGIVCGHIHMPEISCNQGMLYLNPGDFIYHCTAIAESFNGKFSIIKG
jgi:UDP-2,3-diacylglucosamine pyrophosphatase LpxH